ncbi:MAG: ribonuclease domain-containing protein [Oscillospiraceae bacterium]
MKKLLSVLLAALMVFTLCACSNDANKTDPITPANDTSVSSEIPLPDEVITSEPSLTPEQPNAPPTAEQPAPTEGSPDAATTELPTADVPAATTAATEPAPQETTAATTVKAPETTPATEPVTAGIDENGSYTSRDDVALYIHTFGHLPGNFITKKEAQALGWSGGSLEPYAPGKCIGGSHFGNYEGLLPERSGRSYTECDIDTLGRDSRGAKRIVFSNDGLIYYTDDHYESFTLLYGEE